MIKPKIKLNLDITNLKNNTMEEREGTITSVLNGKLRDNFSGDEFEFVNPASVTIGDGSVVIYVSVITPRKVVRILKEVKL